MTDLWKKHLASNWNAFDTYKVTILIKDIVGGKPATPDMIEAWVDATNKEKLEAERQKIKEAHMDTLPELADEKADKQSCVFARVDGVLCIEGRQIKAMLKEAGNIIKQIAPAGDGKTAPIAALKSKVADQVFVVEDYIPLGRGNGIYITEPDDRPERPIHVITARGPRTSIKRVEVVRDVEVTFTVKRRKGRDKGAVPEKVLLAILDYAQEVGLGADRSQGFGCFSVLSVEKQDA